MIYMLTAKTQEIDDVELAVSQLLEQLDLEHNLRKNAAGIVTCYSEFIESGVLGALCDKLPFDVVGTTTLGNASGGEHSLMMLSLTVLTGDDVQFATVFSEPLSGERMWPVRDAYARAKAELSSDPTMMFSFVPLAYYIGGDETVALLDEVSGGIPNFGTVAVDHTPDYHTSRVFLNGEVYTEQLVLMLISGDVHPEFLIASISEDKIIEQQAIITASEGNILKEVNGIPVLQYMESLGLAENGRLDGAVSIPYMVDFGDGAPVARAIYAMSPEGYAICGGAMPVNATLSVGMIDHADVMRTTEQLLKQALNTGKRSGMLMFSCISRFTALGMDIDAELTLVEDTLYGQIPYQFTYSGGEICPVYSANGELHNRFHNDTLVVCVF